MKPPNFWGNFLFFHYLKVLFVDSTDGYGVASKIEDELTVTVDTDDYPSHPLKMPVSTRSFTWSLANFSNGSLRNVTLSGLSFKTVMKGCIILSLIDAGIPLHLSFTK